jgi:hypothetical protein
MLPFAHLGLGSVMARPIAPKLPFRWLLLGTLLPDLIDKPVFLALALLKHAHDGGWVPGKRGIAHTAVFLLLLASISVWRRSSKWWAVTVGVVTHLILDLLSKQLSAGAFTVFLWPLLGWDFPTLAYGLHGTAALALEVVGFTLLLLQVAVTPFRPASM